MKSYENILVGVNYTESSRTALRAAAQVANRAGSKLTVCHVVTAPDQFLNFYALESEAMLEAARSTLVEFVEEALGSDHQAIFKVVEGVPHHEISSLAIEGHHDLLVLGDDDVDGSRKAGQFAIRCLRFVSMPLLLVREERMPEEHVIAACIDFSKSTTPVLQHASFIASPEDQVHLLHVCQPPWLRPERLRYQTSVFVDQGQKEQFREILEGQLTSVRESAEPLFEREVQANCVEAHEPIDALLEYLNKHDCSLIVLGRQGKGFKGIVSNFLGGTAEMIIREAKSSVLIVPIVD